MEQPQFYPEAVLHQWDAVEIHPVKELEDGNCEVTDQEDEDFWSVYIHHTEPQKYGSLSCVADVDTKEEARDLSALLVELMKYHKS